MGSYNYGSSATFPTMWFTGRTRAIGKEEQSIVICKGHDLHYKPENSVAESDMSITKTISFLSVRNNGSKINGGKSVYNYNGGHNFLNTEST